MAGLAFAVAPFTIVSAPTAHAQFGLDCQNALAALSFRGGSFGNEETTLVYLESDFSISRSQQAASDIGALGLQFGDLVANTLDGRIVSAFAPSDFPAIRPDPSQQIADFEAFSEGPAGSLVGFGRGDNFLTLLPEDTEQPAVQIPVIDKAGTPVSLNGSDIAFDPATQTFWVQNQPRQLLSITISEPVPGNESATATAIQLEVIDGPNDIASAVWIGDDGRLLTYHGSGSLWWYNLTNNIDKGVKATVLSTQMPISAQADAAPCRQGAAIKVLQRHTIQTALVPGTRDELTLEVRNSTARTLTGVLEPIGAHANFFDALRTPVRLSGGERQRFNVPISLPPDLGPEVCFQFQLISNLASSRRLFSDDPDTPHFFDQTCFLIAPPPLVDCAFQVDTDRLIPAVPTSMGIEISNTSITPAYGLRADIRHTLPNFAAAGALAQCAISPTCSALDQRTLDQNACSQLGLEISAGGLTLNGANLPAGLPSEPQRICLSVPFTMSSAETNALTVTGQADYQGQPFPCESLTQTVWPTADVSVHVSNNTDSYQPNQPSQFEVVIENPGPSDAIGLGFVNEMPAVVADVQKVEAQCSCREQAQERAVQDRTQQCLASLSTVQASTHAREILLDSIDLPAGCQSTLTYEVNYD